MLDTLMTTLCAPLGVSTLGKWVMTAYLLPLVLDRQLDLNLTLSCLLWLGVGL